MNTLPFKRRRGLLQAVLLASFMTAGALPAAHAGDAAADADADATSASATATASARAEAAAQHDQARAEAKAERTQARQQAQEQRQEQALQAAEQRAEAMAAQAEQRAEEALQRVDLADIGRNIQLAQLDSLPLLAAGADGMSGHKHHNSVAGEDAEGSGGGSGETQVDEHRPLDPAGHISINDIAGSVVVNAWNRNEVAITGTLGYGVERLELTGDAKDLSVVVKLPKHAHSTGDSDLRLMVPAGADVELETVSADVSVQGTHGPVKISTVSGDVGLDTQSPQVAVQTVSGDLILRAPSSATQVNSVSGDLHLSGVQGQLSAETVSGNLAINGLHFSEMKLKSVSGDVAFDGTFTPQARVTGETLSGNITLHVPDDITGTAQIRSFSGDAQCEVRRAAMSPASTGKKRDFVFGDGKGVDLQLSTFSGDVRIDRRNPAGAASK